MPKLAERVHFPLAVYKAKFSEQFWGYDYVYWGARQRGVPAAKAFAQSRYARLSFGRRLKDGSPDIDQGRSFVELLWCRDGTRSITNGWIEFKGQTYRDPHFAGGQITVSQQAKRVSHKQALRQLLEAIDKAARDQAQTHVLASALEQARRLAA